MVVKVQNTNGTVSLFQKIKCFIGFHQFEIVKPSEIEIEKMKQIENLALSKFEHLIANYNNPNLSDVGKSTLAAKLGVLMDIGENGQILPPHFTWRTEECQCCHKRKIENDIKFY